MRYSFIKNDQSSFSPLSGVYDIHDLYNFNKVKTVLVIGYEPSLNKYYITMLGDDPLYLKYGLYKEDITISQYLSVLREFFEHIDNGLIDIEDIVNDKSYITVDTAPLDKDNFLYYMNEPSAYYDEDLERHHGLVFEEDDHCTFLIDEKICLPYIIEDCGREEQHLYSFNLFYELWNENAELDLWCAIDFKKLYE